ncbi:MAG: hypothetical protein AB7T49_15165 [Oligoflexales bacterium]
MTRTQKTCAFLAMLILGIAPLLTQCEDKKSRSEPEDEDATPPENIAGTYLTCEYTSTSTSKDTEVGCKLADARTDKKADLSNAVQSAEWQYSNETTDGVTITVTETPSNNEYNATYLFQGASQEETRSAAQKTYIKVPIYTKDAQEVEIGSPMRDTFTSHYMTGDFDADGYVDLLDRNIDGSADLHVFNSSSSASFPFKSESSDDLNWNYSHYISAKFVSNNPKNFVVARNLEGGFYSLYEYDPEIFSNKKGEKWGDPGFLGKANSKSFFRDFSHYVVGNFNGNQETILMRKTDGTLEHRFVISDSVGTPIPGTWNFEHYIAGDFDGNGKDDLMTIDLQGEGHVYFNKTTNGKADLDFDAGIKLQGIGLHTCTDFVAEDFLTKGVDQVVCRKMDGTLDMIEPTVAGSTVTWSLRRSVGSGWDALAYFAIKLDKNGPWLFAGRTDAKKIETLEIK